MFNVQGSEIIIILVLALIVLGPEKLPDAIRRFTKFYGEFKKMSTGFQSELRNALDEPMKELRDTADLVRKNTDLRELTGTATPSTAPKAESTTKPKSASMADANVTPQSEPAEATAPSSHLPPPLGGPVPDGPPPPGAESSGEGQEPTSA